jgi:hypothetical protein
MNTNKSDKHPTPHPIILQLSACPQAPTQSRESAPAQPTELKPCESIVATGPRGFAEVGKALAIINNQRLYHPTYATFPEYCRERWHMSSARAYRLIAAAEAVELLSSIGETQLPHNEAQARLLSEIGPNRAPQVWKAALLEAGDANVTAKPRLKHE